MPPKTNALRILETAKIQFQTLSYDASDGRIDGCSVAEKIGRPAERVFKTLVASGKRVGPCVFMIPVDFTLNLKKAAEAAGDKNVEMILSKELEPLTGYVHGGCSPIGMKKRFPTFLEETAFLCDTIVVSAGRIGLQVEVAPDDLLRLCKGVCADLI